MGVTNMPEKANPLINLAAGGIFGPVSKTITAPLEKVKLAIQNQDSNPRVLSGEMKRYTGMVDCKTPHLRTRCQLALARKRCQLRSLRADRCLQPHVQGHHQGDVPEVQQEHRLWHVCSHPNRQRCFCRRYYKHTGVPSHLCAYRPWRRPWQG